MSTPLAGDHADDDAQVIDSLIEPQNNPLPKPVQVMTTPVTGGAVKTTRLLTGTMVINADWDPQLILPADANRVEVTIQNNSASDTDVVLISDDKDKLQAGIAGYQIRPNNPLTLRGHTGPVYAASGSDVLPSYLSWVAVSS